MEVPKTFAHELSKPQSDKNAMSPSIFILYFHIHFKFCFSVCLEVPWHSWTSQYLPMQDPISFAHVPKRSQTKSCSQLTPAGEGIMQNDLEGNDHHPKQLSSVLLLCLQVGILAKNSRAKSRCALWNVWTFSYVPTQLSYLLPVVIDLWLISLISFLRAGEAWCWARAGSTGCTWQLEVTECPCSLASNQGT